MLRLRRDPKGVVAGACHTWGMWTCPSCARPFGKTNQSHMCAPGLSIDEFFATAHERERPIYDAVADHLSSIGEITIEFVQVGIFFKNGPNIAQLRTMKKWMALCLYLPEKVNSTRFSRKTVPAGGKGSRWYHVINVTDASEIDDQVLEWLTHAYLAVDE